MNGRVAVETTEAIPGDKKGCNCNKHDRYGDKDKGGRGGKGKSKGKGQSDNPILPRLRRARAYRDELSIQVGQQHRRRGRAGLIVGRASLKEKRQKSSRAWRHLTTREGGAGPRREESPGGEGDLTHDRQFTISLRKTKMNRHQGDWITWSHEVLEEVSGRGRKPPLCSTQEQQRM